MLKRQLRMVALYALAAGIILTQYGVNVSKGMPLVGDTETVEEMEENPSKKYIGVTMAGVTSIEEVTEISEVSEVSEETTEVIAETEVSEVEETVTEETAETEEIEEKEPAVLNALMGVNYGPSGKETWYNMDMKGVVWIMRVLGYSEEEYPYWVREDGVKMLGDYIMVGADFTVRPRGTILECSLGMAIVCDTGDFSHGNSDQLDIAVNW